MLLSTHQATKFLEEIEEIMGVEWAEASKEVDLLPIKEHMRTGRTHFSKEDGHAAGTLITGRGRRRKMVEWRQRYDRKLE